MSARIHDAHFPPGETVMCDHAQPYVSQAGHIVEPGRSRSGSTPIPDDVLIAAEAVVDAIFCFDGGEVRIASPRDRKLAVCRAIMAETERCADVADRMAAAYAQSKNSRDVGVVIQAVAQQEAAEEVAAMLRLGLTP